MAKLSYKVSYYALYACIAIILVVFGLFFFVGYNNPVGEYNSPANTDTVIYLMYAMFAVCVAVTLIGAFAQFGTALKDNPKAALKSLAGLVLIVAVLVVSYSIGSDATVMTGTGAYTDKFWLKITDMLLYSTYFLLAVAVVGALINMTGIFKK